MFEIIIKTVAELLTWSSNLALWILFLLANSRNRLQIEERTTSSKI